LFHAEFEEDLLVISCDINYVRRFACNPEFSLVMDGTFKSLSTSFYQVYIIHCYFNNQSFPILYCFLSGKSERLYLKIFNIIKNKFQNQGINFNPTNIQIDFEFAVFNALRSLWPNTKISGCYFHFAQSIWRKVQNFGLVSRFNDDENFRTCIEMCYTLPLVPIGDLNDAWQIIKNIWSTQDNEINSLLSFVESNWICGTSGPIG
jgi:hypothetical protein